MADQPDNSIAVQVARFIIFPISFIGNSIILYITYRFEKFRSSVANSLIALNAFCDILVVICLIAQAYYSFHIRATNLTSFSRPLCMALDLPQIFGIIFSQVIFLSMAIDRFMAVKWPISYYKSNSKARVYITALCGTICASFFVFIAMFKLDKTPTPECSAGAAGTYFFVHTWVVFAVTIALLIFGIYAITIIMIIKKSKSTDRDIKLSMAAQKRVFSSISLLLLGYAIFWCLPLIVLIISETVYADDPRVIGYVSLVIGLAEGVDSCTGIFICMAKHQELRKCFFTAFPGIAKITGFKDELSFQNVISKILSGLKMHTASVAPQPSIVARQSNIVAPQSNVGDLQVAIIENYTNK